MLGGGARDVLLPLTVAGLAALDCIAVVFGYSDVDGAVRELDLPQLSAPLNEPARSTLRLVAAESPISLPRLAQRSDASKSTIARHVNRLADAGAVETWMEGRVKQVEITTTGRLLHGRSS